MNQLELIITEGEKAGGTGVGYVEFGIPVRDAVERDGEQFIVLSAKCASLAELQVEVDNAHAKPHEVMAAAKANFRRWGYEKQQSSEGAKRSKPEQ
jgi:hypothetical protein